MYSKFNVLHIISEHVRTIYEKDKRGEVNELYFYFGMPILFSLLALFAPVTEGIATLISTVMSIFSGLLLNVQVLICDIKTKLIERSVNQINADGSTFTDSQKHNLKAQQQLTEELFKSISFAIVLTLITIISLFLWYLWTVPKQCYVWYFPITWKIGTHIFSAIIYYEMILFLLTMFMIVKRSYALVMATIIRAK